MQAALEQAQSAFDRDEVPIGAVIVNRKTDDIVARASNRTRELADPSAHAEILAIREACGMAGAQRIPDMDLYVTLEPCPMCAAAISYARIHTVVIGADDPKSGGVLHGPALYEHSAMHHKPCVEHGLYANDSAALLKTFFKSKR
mgnify:CR=1 FL=1